jgi:ABC-type branched-subunit amino acid transport system ATPase component
MLLEVKNLNAGYGFLQILRARVAWTWIQRRVRVPGGAQRGRARAPRIKTIAGLVAPMSGEILFDGENIAGLPGNQVAQSGHLAWCLGGDEPVRQHDRAGEPGHGGVHHQG